MPLMPAFCDNCNNIFPSGFMVENSINVSFSGCICGPCPKCGGNGHIPDGVYSVIKSIISYSLTYESSFLTLGIRNFPLKMSD